MNTDSGASRRVPAVTTVTSIGGDAVRDISRALTALTADMFALHIKTKSFQWHVSGAHCLDYGRLLREQAGQILATADATAERARALGGSTLRSISHILRLQRVMDNDADYMTPSDMLAELRDDNAQVASRLLEAHGLCWEYRDVATASLIQNWAGEAEGRARFLSDVTRNGESE